MPRPNPAEHGLLRSPLARLGAAGAIAAGLVALGAGAVLEWVGGPVARGQIERSLTQRLDRPVHLSAVKLHLLSATPEADFDGLRIGQPAWAGPGDMVEVAHVHVRMPWSALTGGELRFEVLELDRPTVRLLRDQQGRANWAFSAGTREGAPVRLPFVGRLTIRQGRLQLRDMPRETSFEGSVTTDPQGAQQGALRLRAVGWMQRKPFRLAVDGAPLSGLSPNTPYQVAATGRAGDTVLQLQVSLARPFDFGHFSGSARSSGASLLDLYGMLGVALPNTPSYALSVKIVRDGQHYDLGDLGGRMGRSDVEGRIQIDRVGTRRRIAAELKSRRLQFADLLALIGGKAGGHTAGKASSARHRGKRPSRPALLLPDAPLYVDRLRSLDARVNYAARDVQFSALPIRRLAFAGRLERGVLTVSPLSIQLTRGVVTGRVRIDARGATPVSDLDVRLAGFQAEDVLGFLHAPKALTGPIAGRLHLRGRGLSVHRAAAAAEGEGAVSMPGGHVKRSLGDLIGGNVAAGFLGLMSKDQSEAALRCGVGVFQVQGGRAILHPLTIDTSLAVFDGTGGLDLGAETMSLRLQGRSKTPQVLSVLTPITLSGSWRRPEFRLDKAQLARAGAVDVLSRIVSPVAKILPGLAPKPAPDVDCAALLARASRAR